MCILCIVNPFVVFLVFKGIVNFLWLKLNRFHSVCCCTFKTNNILLPSSSQLLRRIRTETLSFLPCRTVTHVKTTVTLSTCPPAAGEAGLPPNAAAVETSPKSPFRFWGTGCMSIASMRIRQSKRNWACLDRRICLCHRWAQNMVSMHLAQNWSFQVRMRKYHVFKVYNLIWKLSFTWLHVSNQYDVFHAITIKLKLSSSKEGQITI